MTTADTIVVTDTRLDSEAFLLDGVDVSAKPLFSVSEVAKVFFGLSGHWIRWLETTKHAFVLDGADIEFSRTDKGARVYSLADVEKMTHALAQGSHINGAQAANALLIVQTIARIHGYLP